MQTCRGHFPPFKPIWVRLALTGSGTSHLIVSLEPCCFAPGTPAIPYQAHLLFCVWNTSCSVPGAPGTPPVLYQAHVLFST